MRRMGFSHGTGVVVGNDQHVARIDRLDIEEGGAAVVLVDDARGSLSRDDRTEDTVAHHPPDL